MCKIFFISIFKKMLIKFINYIVVENLKNVQTNYSSYFVLIKKHCSWILETFRVGMLLHFIHHDILKCNFLN